jgi:hypothetical protein
VRGENLGRIISRKESWIPPFVIQLVGEYVVEILEAIHNNLSSLDSTVYAPFLNDNISFWETTKQLRRELLGLLLSTDVEAPGRLRWFSDHRTPGVASPPHIWSVKTGGEFACTHGPLCVNGLQNGHSGNFPKTCS